jgi:hypothetical protein
MALARRCFARLGRGMRAYAAAALLNLALLNTTLAEPPRRPIVHMRVVAATGPFLPTEVLARPGGELAGVLSLPLPDGQAVAPPSPN